MQELLFSYLGLFFLRRTEEVQSDRENTQSRPVDAETIGLTNSHLMSVCLLCVYSETVEMTGCLRFWFQNLFPQLHKQRETPVGHVRREGILCLDKRNASEFRSIKVQ